MDNFSLYQYNLDIIPPPLNIVIRFLPANITLLYQPLDQGIINNTKQIYRRSFLYWICFKYPYNTDPIKAINLKRIIIWLFYT